MFEFEDISSGFHDILLNKYTDSSGPILDFYISDSMQDMLDIDIRSEVATVVGGASEFSSLVNDIPSSLDLEFGTSDGEISWLGGPKLSATTDIYADVGACVNPSSVMPLITSSLLNSSKAQINLNTNNLRSNNSPPSSPKDNKSHLTFSPHQIKVPSLIAHENKRPSPLATMSTTQTSSSINRNLAENIKKDLLTDLKDDKSKKILSSSSLLPLSSSSSSNNVSTANMLSGSNTIKLGHGIGGLTFSNNIAYNKVKQSNAVKISGMNGSGSTGGGNVTIKIDKELSSSPNNGNILNGLHNENNTQQNSHKIVSRSILVQNNNKNITMNGGGTNSNSQSTNNNNNNNHHSSSSAPLNTKPVTSKSSKLVEHEYPKPAYSYSCLIAMALKNSRSGSLPVSEIYSFMCEHFPYFKTAPNGWKNSVRHNLSLNKCFEKIEKPITHGSQRKGCLWAMNPTKITKMDEEVQKWSRKDPMAIRKAMVYPEHLEALERGEMKHGSTSDSDIEGDDTQSDAEENSDNEQDHDLDENLIEATPESVNDDDADDNGEGNDDNSTEIDNKNFDHQITNIYDTIVDIEDDKDIIHRQIQQQRNNGDFLESDNSSLLAKRARLDVNYSISSTGIIEQQQQRISQQQQRQINHNQHQQQQQQQSVAHHNRRKMPLVNRIA